jgi:hypothetical protein
MKADPRDHFKPLPLEAVTYLTEGRLIDAIKSVRASHGLGLKESKDWVDAHLADDPALRVLIETRQRAARRKFFFWFVVVDVIVFAGLYYYFIHLQK